MLCQWLIDRKHSIIAWAPNAIHFTISSDKLLFFPSLERVYVCYLCHYRFSRHSRWNILISVCIANSIYSLVPIIFQFLNSRTVRKEENAAKVNRTKLERWITYSSFFVCLLLIYHFREWWKIYIRIVTGSIILNSIWLKNESIRVNELVLSSLHRFTAPLHWWLPVDIIVSIKTKKPYAHTFAT